MNFVKNPDQSPLAPPPDAFSRSVESRPVDGRPQMPINYNQNPDRYGYGRLHKPEKKTKFWLFALIGVLVTLVYFLFKNSHLIKAFLGKSQVKEPEKVAKKEPTEAIEDPNGLEVKLATVEEVEAGTESKPISILDMFNSYKKQTLPIMQESTVLQESNVLNQLTHDEEE